MSTGKSNQGLTKVSTSFSHNSILSLLVHLQYGKHEHLNWKHLQGVTPLYWPFEPKLLTQTDQANTNVWGPNSRADESATCGMRQRALTISSWLSSRTISLNNTIITQSLRNCCSWTGQNQQCWLNDSKRDGSHKGRTKEMFEMIIYSNTPSDQIHAKWDLCKHTHAHFTI